MNIMDRSGLKINKDITVIGGGLAGICASVAAAREGASIALVHNRPVLGGNSSSEMRIWTVGATAMGNNRFAMESGIIGELDLENLYRNPEGNPYLWDALLLDLVNRERNIQLFLNTEVVETTSISDKITSVKGYQSGTEKIFIYESKLFIDCTGDGSVGYWAGANYMKGKEGYNVFEEDMAKEQSEKYTLGSTILFYVKEMKKPIKYIAPDFAYSIEHIRKLLTDTNKKLDINSSGCDFWWIEYGGELDTIGDNERIKEELLRLIYGIWDYIKNSGEFNADRLEIEWVGSMPAKRESRRFVGDLVLTQNHILQHHLHKDVVCCGGWPIDTHPEEGIYSEKSSCRQEPAGIYQIPIRCLYSKNIKNLLFAGRNISVSHLAFASTRVMKTCALTGQAAGILAATAAKAGRYPRETAETKIEKIQQRLAKSDVWLFGLVGADKENIARDSTVKASGYRKFSSEDLVEKISLNRDIYILMPALDSLKRIGFLIQSVVEGKIDIEVYTANALQNYRNLVKLGKFTSRSSTFMDWVTFDCNLELDGIQNVIIKIPNHNGAYLGISRESCCGVIGSRGSIRGMELLYPCFQLTPEPVYFSPENVTNGTSRPENKPNIWISNSISSELPWISLNFEGVKTIKEVQLLFNPDFNRDYNHLRPDYYKNGWDKMPQEMVKSFSLKARGLDGSFKEIVCVENQIVRQFKIKETFETDCIRVDFYKTYGSSYAQLFEIKVYC